MILPQSFPPPAHSTAPASCPQVSRRNLPPWKFHLTKRNRIRSDKDVRRIFCYCLLSTQCECLCTLAPDSISLLAFVTYPWPQVEISSGSRRTFILFEAKNSTNADSELIAIKHIWLSFLANFLTHLLNIFAAV